MGMESLPNGAVVERRGRLYFVSQGLEARIATRTDGMWFFLREPGWRTFRVRFLPARGSTSNRRGRE